MCRKKFKLKINWLELAKVGPNRTFFLKLFKFGKNYTVCSKWIQKDPTGSSLKYPLPSEPDHSSASKSHFLLRPSQAQLGYIKSFRTWAQQGSDFEFVTKPSQASPAQSFWLKPAQSTLRSPSFSFSICLILFFFNTSHPQFELPGLDLDLILPKDLGQQGLHVLILRFT